MHFVVAEIHLVGRAMASQAWNRDAVPAEKAGFDCAKAHPAQGNYHHHQNPSAFNLDLNVISTVCDTYPSDGLYVINSVNIHLYWDLPMTDSRFTVRMRTPILMQRRDYE
jgi:hypothetical protein